MEGNYGSKAFAKRDGTWLDEMMAVMHQPKQDFCFHYSIVGLIRIK